MTLREQLWTIAVCVVILAGTGVMAYRFLQPML
jgi:hypothetical protein